MINRSERYDTFVIRGSTKDKVLREAAGGEVVAWSAGHALAEFGPLMEFVTDLAGGAFSDVEAIEAEAQRVLEVSEHQREHGWIEDKTIPENLPHPLISKEPTHG